jgi:hypothetical protein
MSSLVFAAKVHKFREPEENETEADYRATLAAHVEPRDMIGAHEIRTGKGWDNWDRIQKKDLMRRSGFQVPE